MIIKLLSVITVCYNSEKTIGKTIESILNQSYEKFEYIIIDGKSQDKTVEIIKKYEPFFNKRNIVYKWISESDSGIYEAFNKGIQIAKSNWISFLGSDDCYTPEALYFYANSIGKIKQEVDFVYSNIDVLDDKNRVIKQINVSWSWKVFRRHMNIGHVGAFHNKNYFNKYGLFNTDYKIAGDYELLLRAKENLKTLKIPQTTVKMGNGGVSFNQTEMVFDETFKAKRFTAKINVLNCYIDYYNAVLKFYIKKILHALIR